MKRLIKLFVLLFVLLLAAVIVVPLVALAGLFIWLKLTEEADDEAMDLVLDSADEVSEA
ncbi:MAG: hypothetical protein QOJ81_1215 [Chloroflexota bacterium]|nr:hypothetical protein [Chloroflexota bacterium]